MHRPTIPAAAIVLVILGSLDRFLGIIRARPLGEYSGVLTGIFNSLAYFLIYGIIWAVRAKTGSIDPEHLRYISGGMKDDIRKNRHTDQLRRVNSSSLSRSSSRVGGASSPGLNDSGFQDFKPADIDPDLPTVALSPALLVSTASDVQADSHHREVSSAATLPDLPAPKGSWHCKDLGAWKYICLAGLCDSMSTTMSFAAQPYLAGITVTLLDQVGSPLVAGWSMLLLKVRYSAQEVFGICLLIGGVILALEANNRQTHNQPVSTDNKMGYALLILVSALPLTLSYVLKEKVFKDFADACILSMEREELSMAYVRALDRSFTLPVSGSQPRLVSASSLRVSTIDSAAGVLMSSDSSPHTQYPGGTSMTSRSGVFATGSRSNSLLMPDAAVPPRPGRVNRAGQDVIVGQSPALDVWCVISTSAFFQMLWSPFVVGVCMFVICNREKRDLFEYLTSAMTCLGGTIPDWDVKAQNGALCDGAWEKYLLYMVVNLLYNVSLYVVMQQYSAILSFVAQKLTAPLSVLLFVLPLWRWLGYEPQSSNIWEACSFLVMLVGLTLFRHGTETRERQPGPPTACCWLGQIISRR